MLGVGPELGGDDHVGGQHDVAAQFPGALEVAAAGVELVDFQQRAANLVALGLEEGEGHAAADQQVVGAAQQVVDDSQLVRDLGTAQDHHVGALGSLGEGLEDLHLGGHQVALVGREQGGDVEDRWRACGAPHRRRR